MDNLTSSRLPIANDNVVLGKNLHLPAYGTDSIISTVIFVTGKRGSGKCLVAGSKVLMADGSWIPIEELEYREDKTLVAFNDSYQPVIADYTDFYKRTINKTLKIITASGNEIELTPEHPLLTVDGWTEAKDLEIKNRIATPWKTGILNTADKISLEKAEILGYLISEGYLASEARPNNQYTFTNGDLEIISKFKELINKEYPDIEIKQYNQKYNYALTNATTLRKDIKTLGLHKKNSGNKFIPSEVMSSSKNVIAAFLKGLFSGDGGWNSYENPRNIEYCSKSKQLAMDTKYALMRLGIHSRLSSRIINDESYYRICLYAADVYKFCKEVGFVGYREKAAEKYLKEVGYTEGTIHTIPSIYDKVYEIKNDLDWTWSNLHEEMGMTVYETEETLPSGTVMKRKGAVRQGQSWKIYDSSREKMQKLATATESEELMQLANSAIIWDTIVSIEENLKEQEVYDISVPLYHNFISEGIIVHNSWTTAVMMEEFNRLGLQFVCFDALDAHGNLKDLDGIEALEPKIGQSIDMKALVQRLAETNKSLVIKLVGLPLDKQQILVADYCEALLEAHLGKGIHTVIEECQDFIPQMGRPISYDPIVRLCKLGRALGYGVTLVSQRPAGVNKEALSQAAIYLVHNVINNRDLKALDDQLSFGTDKRIVKRLLNGIAAARKGEVVAYAPEYFRDKGYIIVDKVRGDRRTEHKGHNIDVQAGNIKSASNQMPESPIETVASLSELKHLEHKPVMDLPDSLMNAETSGTQSETQLDANRSISETQVGTDFYPSIGGTQEISTENLTGVETNSLLKNDPKYKWASDTIDSKPSFEYDKDLSIDQYNSRTSSSSRRPLLAIGATVILSSITYAVFRNITE